MERFHWLNPHDAEVWGTLWGFITWVPARLDEHMKRAEHMGLTDYLTLLAIGQAEGGQTTMSKLAQAVWMSPSRLSHVMDRLEDRGLAERSRSNEDRRSTFASLTEAGEEFMVRATPEMIEHMRSTIFEAVTPEEADQLNAIMKKIMAKQPHLKDPYGRYGR